MMGKMVRRKRQLACARRSLYREQVVSFTVLILMERKRKVTKKQEKGLKEKAMLCRKEAAFEYLAGRNEGEGGNRISHTLRSLLCCCPPSERSSVSLFS
jgi:hypothetical protein